jgi:hypothetical protein
MPATMKTYPIFDDKKGDRPFSFEIENIYVSRRTVARLLKKGKGVTHVRLGGHFSSSNDIRVEFKYRNHDYIVLEPYGDNSRYWIGPKNPVEHAGDIGDVESVFKHYRPPFHRALLGNALTLRLFKRAQ